ncbi:MAG TPA: DUF1573 domain-containing protein [Phycisphaerales bacterium]|nr:DUF1573 domain-containing protein [Phycisphaerales bacterium]HMP38723.1 DUF1573 domain-containing protein [Phycisphaerales bacterium]
MHLFFQPLLGRRPLLDGAAFVDGSEIPSYLGSRPLSASLSMFEWEECACAASDATVVLRLDALGSRWMRATVDLDRAGGSLLPEVEVVMSRAAAGSFAEAAESPFATYRWSAARSPGESAGLVVTRTTTLAPEGHAASSATSRYVPIQPDARWRAMEALRQNPLRDTPIVHAGLGVTGAVGSTTLDVSGVPFTLSAPLAGPGDVERALWSLGASDESSGTATPRPLTNDPGPEDGSRNTALTVSMLDLPPIEGRLGERRDHVAVPPIQYAGEPVELRSVVRLLNGPGDARLVSRVAASCGCLEAVLRSERIEPGDFLELSVTLRLREPGTRRERVTILFEDGAVEEIVYVVAIEPRGMLRGSPQCFDAAMEPRLDVTLLFFDDSEAVPPAPRWSDAGEAEPEAAQLGLRAARWEMLDADAPHAATSAVRVWRTRLVIDREAFASRGRRMLAVGAATMMIRGDGMPWE